MSKNKALALKLVLVVAGLAVVALGISAYYASGFGSDPASLLVDGVHRALSISYGAASWIVLGIILVLMLPFGRKFIGIGTLMNAVLLGVFMNLFQAIGLFAWVTQETHIVIRIALMSFGILLLGVGLGSYISADLGAGPLDILVLEFSERFKKPIFATRLAWDFVFAIIGFALGGVIGVGTIAGVVFTGFIIQFTLKNMRKVVGSLTAEATEAVKPTEIEKA